MHVVLQNHIPEKLDNKKIQVTLNSISQKKDMTEKINSELMGFLKNELSNYSIEIIYTVAEEIKNQNLIYTAQDKFNYLAEKNEAINLLKKSFNLDFE